MAATTTYPFPGDRVVKRCTLCGDESPPGPPGQYAGPARWAAGHVCAIIAYGRALDAAANRATRAAGG